jgi:hypothetical protein
MANVVVPVDVFAPATREHSEKAVSLLLTLPKMEKELAARLKEWVWKMTPFSATATRPRFRYAVSNFRLCLWPPELILKTVSKNLWTVTPKP